jgi:hypothetical protein
LPGTQDPRQSSFLWNEAFEFVSELAGHLVEVVEGGFDFGPKIASQSEGVRNSRITSFKVGKYRSEREESSSDITEVRAP